MNEEPEYIVVIGTSAGGFNALYELVGTLDPEVNAAYLIVLHLSARSIGGYLAQRLQEYTRLKCLLAMDTMPLRKGYIYVAVPNYHMIVTTQEVKLNHGPLENRWRPSIDVLFRSAAAHFTNRVIGIILTGLLNDGTTGMSAIKRSGGHTIVQDPKEAEYPDMPSSVLQAMEVDYCVSLTQMSQAIKEITGHEIQQEIKAPADLMEEARIYENLVTDIKSQERTGKYSPYTCPDCGGALFLHEQDNIIKYKCHVGHSYTERDLLSKLSEEVESSLWFAIRSLEQRKNLLSSLAEKYSKTGGRHFSNDYMQRSGEIDQHINNLKSILNASLEQTEE